MRNLFIYLFILILAPSVSFAYCYGPAYDANAKNSGMELCACTYNGVYPNCGCPTGKTIEGNDCVCSHGTVPSGTGCVAGTSDKQGRYEPNENDATQCKAAKCEVPKTMLGSTVEPTYDYATGVCSCPPGYVSKVVDDFNKYRGNSSASSTAGGGGSNSNSKSVSGTIVSGAGVVPGNLNSKSITPPSAGSKAGVSNPISVGSFSDLLQRLADWILNIAIVIAPLVVVYGGYLHVTAIGEIAKINKARNVILFGTIGFIIALMARGLVDLFRGLVVK